MFVKISTGYMYPRGMVMFDKFIHLNTLCWVSGLLTWTPLPMYLVADEDNKALPIKYRI